MNIGDPQSFNRYAYVSGDPVNFIDPSGLYGECTTAAGQVVLTVVSPAAPNARLVYGGSGPRLAEQHVTRIQTTNGLSETVLAANVSLAARPQLAAGAAGSLALVWNSVSASGAGGGGAKASDAA
ncbi:MAG TPA: hypothetical protein PL105_27445, partial [Caldilineaceae bacterium]|nr:hypothetical protein [Caldilineaceae bacterium]